MDHHAVLTFRLAPTQPQILHKSLEHMNGNLYCFDAIDHAKRCFSLLGCKRVLDVEIRPTSMQRREERFAAQEIAAAAARTLHRIQQQVRCHTPHAKPNLWNELSHTPAHPLISYSVQSQSAVYVS